jgi:hypothetical protein
MTGLLGVIADQRDEAARTMIVSCPDSRLGLFPISP